MCILTWCGVNWKVKSNLIITNSMGLKNCVFTSCKITKAKHSKPYVCYKQEFVLTKLVITKFVIAKFFITEFDCTCFKFGLQAWRLQPRHSVPPRSFEFSQIWKLQSKTNVRPLVQNFWWKSSSKFEDFGRTLKDHFISPILLVPSIKCFYFWLSWSCLDNQKSLKYQSWVYFGCWNLIYFDLLFKNKLFLFNGNMCLIRSRLQANFSIPQFVRIALMFHFDNNLL